MKNKILCKNKFLPQCCEEHIKYSSVCLKMKATFIYHKKYRMSTIAT
jgi:hypothetical protein